MNDLIKIPKRFIVDHEERDLSTPIVVRTTKSHYFISKNDPACPELLSDAAFYADDGIDADTPELRGLVVSAKATAKALKDAGVQEPSA